MMLLLAFVGFLQRHYRATLTMSGILFLGNVLLLSLHAGGVMDLRKVSLPLAAELSTLEVRQGILQDQIELAELHAVTQVGSPEERMRVFVLPEKAGVDRVLGGFEVLHDVLSKEGSVSSMSRVEVGESFLRSEELRAHPLSLTIEGTEDGLRKVLAFFTFAGSSTVFDALSGEEVGRLFHEAEAENPVGVIAIEAFLATDLLEYASNAESTEQALTRSFASPLFAESLQTLVASSLLPEARLSFGHSLGEELQARGLWPLPFLSIDTLRIRARTEGTYRLSMNLFTFSRV